MKVIHHERRQLPGHFSIERLFREIRRHMPSGFEIESCKAPHASRGLVPRLSNVRHASAQRADVHHVVGDSHYLAFGLPHGRTVHTIHDCAALRRLKGIRRSMLKFFWFTYPVRHAAAVTTISEATRRELIGWLGPQAERIEVVPDCTFGDFRFSPRPFNRDNTVVLQVGTNENKNLERVAEALSGTGCVLHVVGTLSENQKAACGSAGIRWRELGTLADADLVAAYQECDLVAFVSLYEGFGLPILEAQATGRPVITSNTSSLPEAAGDGGLLVDPFSVEEIRDAVLRLKASPDLRESLVEKGRKNAGKFHPRAIAARYAEIYMRVHENACMLNGRQQADMTFPAPSTRNA